MVHDVVTGLAQVGDDLFLQLKTGVIGADVNAHRILPKSYQTRNTDQYGTHHRYARAYEAC